MTTVRSSEDNDDKQSTISIFRSLSDDRSFELFRIIASDTRNSDFANQSNGSRVINTQLLMSKVNLTRKQYYSRVSTLVSSGLVKRSNGKYILTSLGRVAYSASDLIDKAIHNHWKLKAIDALDMKSSSEGLEERDKIVDLLIDDHKLRNILNSKNPKLNEAESRCILQT